MTPFLELLATFFAGIGMAGIFIALRKLSRGRVPGWMTPLAAGATMVFVAIYSEYSWYGRTVAGLPEGMEVAEVNEARQMYRPWTYVAPLVNRFVAVDVASAQVHEAHPGQMLTNIYTWGRWQPINRFPVLIDCTEHRRALIPGDAIYGSDGSVEGAVWSNVPGDDPVLATACKRG